MTRPQKKQGYWRIVGRQFAKNRLADIKRLARGANSVRGRIKFFNQSSEEQHQQQTTTQD